MSDSKLIRGTKILTAATFASKLLGLLYIIPFTAIVGQTGMALYSYGYLPYMVLLSMATLGVPLAVSKFVSKYNALGDYHTGRKLFRSASIVMTLTGLLTFLLLYGLAPTISTWVVRDQSVLEGGTMEDIVFTIRMVSVALLVVPFMSVIRGYFQGFQSMGPTAVSQVVEQIVRIAFILSVTYLIIGVNNGDLGVAVGFATFGAFVGALGGLAVLGYYWFKRRHFLNEQLAESTVNHNIPLKSMYKELISYAIPLSFVGLAIPLFQLIDMFTVVNGLIARGFSKEEADVAFAVIAQTAHKLILIPVALATAFSITLVPTITKSFISGNKEQLQTQITQTYQIILFLTLPAAVGLSVLAYPAFGALYGLSEVEIGGEILRSYAPIALFFSLAAVTSAILQGMNRQKYAVIGLSLGLLVKISLNYWLVLTLEELGAVVGTYLGYTVLIIINVWAIGKFATYNYTLLLKRLILIGIFAAIMAGSVVITRTVLEVWIPLDTHLHAILLVAISTIVGGAVYMALSIRSHLAGKILGHRFARLKRQKVLDSNS
ncbi:putative polysaccharide biosynthesis protein [Bacillus alkalicellulosilyticus]|uniref:putative polysaccharide biosynthesis protein n=1 Tax=Alkalihalobacterium alkalicellulosilyticum TaxID=1912214 RepID=UPI0009983349|nr:polysaccharide biosynthesis protein [Bacillus alkalicellulosilyticus]